MRGFRWLFNKLRFRRPIHLRHLLQFGVGLEERGRDFYETLRRRTENPKVKGLCHKLAEDEVRHKELIEDILHKWDPLDGPMDDEAWNFFEDERRAWGIFLHPPPPTSTEKDMLNYAIDQENRMAEFYLDFEDRFSDSWRRKKVQEMVEEERKHAEQLKDLFEEMEKEGVL